MSFSTADTIVAIATPPGRGALGVVRLSGPSSLSIVAGLTTRTAPFHPRHATLATFLHADRRPLDRVVITTFPAPASYTGDDVVEVSAHGSQVVLQAIVTASIDRGARLAAPGEFTLRAYLNGRIDLPQAEAVADLIDAATPLQARAAFDQLSGTVTSAIAEVDRALFDLSARLEASVDFPDEGYHFIEPAALIAELDVVIAQLDRLRSDAQRGRLIREGRQVVIVGPPNAGKSSLFNALVGSARAIVHDTPGTTRDLVSEAVDIDGVRVTLVDTAGLRPTSDPVEHLGVERSLASLSVADLILSVADSSQPRVESPLSTADARVVIVATKSDLSAVWSDDDAINVSVRTGAGLAELRARIAGGSGGAAADPPPVTNVRHLAQIEKASRGLGLARQNAIEQGSALSEEFLLADLQAARAALEEVTGQRTPDDLLAHVFAHFCIGK